MPRKTKKQKKIARERRKTLPVIQAPVIAPTMVNDTEKRAIIPSVAAVDLENTSLKQVVLADLKKTAILIPILFALEFLIFYANLK